MNVKSKILVVDDDAAVRRALIILFAPFVKLSQVRLKGYGLGLSVVRRIVEKLGGQVGVESVMGQGTVFGFTLPAVSNSG